jgi:hypothetical protein
LAAPFCVPLNLILGQLARAWRFATILHFEQADDSSPSDQQIRAPLAHSVKRLDTRPDLPKSLYDLGLVRVNPRLAAHASSVCYWLALSLLPICSYQARSLRTGQFYQWNVPEMVSDPCQPKNQKNYSSTYHKP